jgi:hypothetical protein
MEDNKRSEDIYGEVSEYGTKGGKTQSLRHQILRRTLFHLHTETCADIRVRDPEPVLPGAKENNFSFKQRYKDKPG